MAWSDTNSALEVLQSRLRALVSSQRLGLFASAGLFGALVDNGLLYALVELAGLGFVRAKVVAWVVAIATLFVINDRLAFASYGLSSVRSIGRRLGRSYLVRFAGFLVTLSVYATLVYVTDLWYIAANVIGIGVGFFVNYTCESLYTWQVHREQR